MTGSQRQDAVVLSWIPLGAPDPAHPARIGWVRLGGWCFGTVTALRQQQPRRAIYHAALQVRCGGIPYAIEMTPVWGQPAVDRGVVFEGPVGSPTLGRSRFFRYEVRCWQGGTIPDLASAVGGPRVLSADAHTSRRLLTLLPECPRLTWGRDESGAHDMWNSNSVIAWLLSRSDHPVEQIRPPEGGSAPGWQAGLVAARCARR